MFVTLASPAHLHASNEELCRDVRAQVQLVLRA